MSEDHDKDGADSDIQFNASQCKKSSAESERATETVQEECVETKSANTPTDVQTSPISSKENIKCNLNDNKDSSGRNVKHKGTLSWTLEGSEFKLSWKLPDGSTSTEDYIALCYAG
ncbi:unnamed protein product [Parnassius apollo]|uniref:(apollo) hypothetical protein n=1 Tax=Parnassius apollo TaxID=110799 RepID=A0A8S3Y315_PARAO|nr:unnamed protein product [Parnassius apollo]